MKIGFWNIVRTTKGEISIYRNGSFKSSNHQIKKLTPEQNKIFDELMENYLKQINN